MKRSTLTLAGFCLLLVAAACFDPGGAGAQTGGGTAAPGASPLQENMARSWYRNYDYGVELDGKLLPELGLYQLVSKPFMLVHGSLLDTGYVWSLEPRVVRPVKKDAITSRGDDELLLAESAFSATTPIPWMQDGPSAVVFYAGQRRFKIVRVPPIVGPTTLDDLFRHSPPYRRGMEEYKPKPEAIQYLKGFAGRVEIEVWFGTWCPHCRVVVPRLLKTVQAAGNPNIGVTYHGVPREFAAYPPASGKDVKGLPTIIFLQGGKEVGRIRGEPQLGTLEEDFVRILKGSPAAAKS